MNSMYDTALDLIKLLNSKGFSSYIVGGYPRDKYLGIYSNDIDICTRAKKSDLVKILGDIDSNKYNSYKVIYKGYTFEITTFRRDFFYFKNRFPKKVFYTRSLRVDLKRRDFVINTLCIDCDGNYVDLLGAKADLDSRRIKLIGGISSFKHDSLRILRAIRFATVLNFKLDSKVIKAINKYKNLLVNISYDRKKSELEKIFKSKNAEYGLFLIQEYGLERFLDINLTGVVITDDVDAMWAQVLIDDSYKFSKKETKKIKIIKKLMHKKFDIYYLYKYGCDILSSVIKIKKDNIDVYKLYNMLPIKDREDIDIDFFVICDSVSVDNESIAILYDDIEKQILYGKLKNEKDAIISYIKKNY